MATLRFKKIKRRESISPITTPEPLRKALRFTFERCGEGLWLVGGTALAGYYAEHRRSDDLDLFAEDQSAFRSAIKAVRELRKIGATLSNERTTPLFYDCDAALEGHHFTIDVVLDEYLHQIGGAFQSSEGVFVVDLATLFATKSACLVSRCSEKDLFDLDWLIKNLENFDVSQIIEEGHKIDGGLTSETLLYSLSSTSLNEEKCHFLLPKSKTKPKDVLKKLESFKQTLIEQLLEYEKSLPLSPDAAALAAAAKLQRKME